jgi:2-oxo-3-hexenedioate decarboxylase
MTAISQERQHHLRALANRLAAAWKAAGQIDAVSDGELPENRSEAYFVQDEMAKAVGDPLSGWKVGATSARMRELDSHDDVVPGRIFNSVTWQGTILSLSAERFPGARAETEFAFRIDRDLPLREAPWRADELAPAAVLHPAIEIIGNRHELPDAPAPVRSLMTIADNGGGIGFVFGDPVDDWQGIDFQNHFIALTVDGDAEAEKFLGSIRCVPIQALADMVNHLASRNISLKAGDFVSTGAATVPQPVLKGSHVMADFGALGKIEIRFE